MSLKVLNVVSECVPFAKAGGLGDVAGSLPKDLARRGHDVRVLMPKYGFIDTSAMIRHAAPIGVPFAGGESWCALWEGRLPGSEVPVYFLEHDALYDGPTLYDVPGTVREWMRFALLNRAAFQVCRYLGFAPDVFHGHDWPTAPLAALLRSVENRAPFDRSISVLSLHNVAHQARFPAEVFSVLHLPDHHWGPHAFEDHGEINPFKAGVALSDLLVAVSPRYAWEITTPLGGAGLHDLFASRRGDLVGILNGVDQAVWDPSTDPRLPARYSRDDLSGKDVCKRELQREMGLLEDPAVPLLGIVCRMTDQKGVDLVIQAAPSMMEQGAQLAALGSGNPAYEAALYGLATQFPGRVAARIGYSEGLAHRIEAGSDFFLMPSRFEPCGLNQMYSQLYGTPPIARRVGGLVDTVVAYPQPGATGFLFDAPNAGDFANAIRQAVDLYRNGTPALRRMQREGMSRDFGWAPAALAYENAFQRSLEKKRA